MSCYEWERGSLKIPAASWKGLKDAVREAYNIWIYEEWKKDLENSWNASRVKTKDKATNRTRRYEAEGLAIAFSEDSVKEVHIEVYENNHARDYAWGTAVGQALSKALNRIQWTSKTGGILIGNDEYNQDTDYPGGGGNYITCHYGGIGERALKAHSRTRLL